MKSFRGIFDLRHKKSLRLGLLLLSALFISSATALVYDRMIYEKPLSVGNAGAVTTGSGSTAPTGVSFSPATISILAMSAFVISLSIFGLVREGRKHISKAPDGRESSPTGPGSMALGEEEGEESLRKEEESSAPSSG